MATLPFRQPYRQPSRQLSTDPHNELNPQMDHYIGIDVGTGSARACIIDGRGNIVGPEQGYYVSQPPNRPSSSFQLFWHPILVRDTLG